MSLFGQLRKPLHRLPAPRFQRFGVCMWENFPIGEITPPILIQTCPSHLSTAPKGLLGEAYWTKGWLVQIAELLRQHLLDGPPTSVHLTTEARGVLYQAMWLRQTKGKTNQASLQLVSVLPLPIYFALGVTCGSL
jgi:hypothetical protein